MKKSIISFYPPDGKRKLFKAGKYLAEVVGGEEVVTPKSKQRGLKLYFKIIDGDHKGALIDHLLLLGGNGVYYFHEFLKVLEIETEYGLVEINAILGRELQIVMEEKKTSSDNDTGWVQVTKVLKK